MLSLILAIGSSAGVSILLRLSEGKMRSRMGFFLTNYAVCTLLAYAFTAGAPLGSSAAFTLGLGCFTGFLFLASFMLYRSNIAVNGIVMASSFMKLGVLIPTVMAITLFREQPKPAQLAGIALALAAIVLLHFEKDAKASRKDLLLLLLVVGGLGDGMINVYDKLGSADGKDFYLMFIFLSAGVFTAILLVLGHEKPGIADLLLGAGIGIPNYFSTRFLMGALQTVPAVVVYPVYSVATILVISAVGVLFFRERLERKKLLALGMILGALALLNA